MVVDRAGFIVEDVVRVSRSMASGSVRCENADGQHVIVDVEDVAALDVERVVAAVILMGSLEIGWYLKMYSA